MAGPGRAKLTHFSLFRPPWDPAERREARPGSLPGPL